MSALDNRRASDGVGNLAALSEQVGVLHQNTPQERARAVLTVQEAARVGEWPEGDLRAVMEALGLGGEV
jgi:hypothetical protein